MEPKHSLDQGEEKRLTQPQTVPAPVAHEGIGLALRCVYLPGCRDMPHDLAGLLAKLH